jgi:hypothetical protein
MRHPPRTKGETMPISFARIGFWKLTALGIALELVHFALGHWYADLSPHHYLGIRSLRNPWAKTLILSEYVVVMAAMVAAVGTIEAMLKNRNYLNAFVVVGVWIAYSALFGGLLNYSRP